MFLGSILELPRSFVRYSSCNKLVSVVVVLLLFTEVLRVRAKQQEENEGMEYASFDGEFLHFK